MVNSHVSHEVARALAVEKPGANWDANKHVQWRLDVRAVASAFARSEATFSRAKFYAVAGYLD